ncbi:ATP-binding protein [Tabrizicola sp. BL-A-41-H6]|uniref:ATP-binding protein n=1 Tax=Tabrizicola sp. BL-A-41-H6 TaxID=3421107 RepID=UPI003D668015
MLSLRKRAWISGSLSALVAMMAGMFLLYSYLNLKVLERFDATLTEHHTRIVAALNNVGDDPARLGELIFDPEYQTPYSGKYWQVTGQNGQIYSSASLFESTLPRPVDLSNRLLIGNVVGPEHETLRAAYQIITLEDGSVWTVAVGQSRAGLNAEREEMRRSLLLAFALVAGMGLVSVLAQTAAILRPLEKLREDVAHRWERDEALSEADYPEEVAPLVTDINSLLERNRDIVGRARRQAADLAHALKTPSAILRNELMALREKRAKVDKALDALDRLDAQLGRSLARIRMSNTGESTAARTDLSHSINRFSRLFSAMAARDGKALTTACDPDLTIRVDAQDIEEVIGNVLDNALKWCVRAIALSARRVGDTVEIRIEDDGPGIPEADRAEALRSGGRLDTSKPGTGLGLAIAIDLLRAYGASLELDTSSQLGGLAVRVTLPARLVVTG